jgi:hypothetical protein
VHRHGGLEVLGVGGDGDQVVAEADFGQGEGGPVEIGVELVGDGDDLGGGRGGGVVLEVDAVGERDRRADVAGGAEAGGAEFLVGVNGAGYCAALPGTRGLLGLVLSVCRAAPTGLRDIFHLFPD